jgi:aminopeptidase N
VPERAAALDDFYERYRDDPLVIDKWFALQATTPAPDTLAQVRKLTQHPAFALTNPNRVRALIGAFAQGNQTQFNRPDGAGYDFVAEHVLALDPANPQMAARMLQAFRSWRALEPGRRALAEEALRRVAAAPDLSRDASDIAQRSLADT